MRAFALATADAQPAVTDVPDPSPGPGEGLVRVAPSSLNGFDASVASGRLHGMMEHRFPVVLGKDFAGTVAAVGEGVSQFAPRDDVFGVVMKPHLGDGGYAVAAGATVVATAKPGQEAEFVTGLGAQHTVDYTSDVPAQVREIAPDGVDAVLHLAGDGAALADLLAPGG